MAKICVVIDWYQLSIPIDRVAKDDPQAWPGYILWVENIGSEFVLPISSPGFPKNGG